MTLKSVLVSGTSTSTNAVDPGCANAAPSSKLAPTTGMLWVMGVPSTVPSSKVPASATMSPDRSGVLPWLKMITASAPATSAKCAFVPKKHVPRCTNAMSAGPLQSIPRKSASSHPLVDARGGTKLMSTGITCP